MTTSRGMEVPKDNFVILRGAFLLIITGFALANVIALFEMHSVETTNRQIVENMLSSIQRVARLAHDVDQKRSLIDAHIFERELRDMERIEKRIGVVDGDFAATSRAYEPLATLTGEHATWEILQGQIASVQQPIDRVLELSRKNQDEEARRAMVAIDQHFDAIDQTAERLIAINHAEAERAAQRVQALQRRAMWLLGGVTMGGTTLSFLTAAWVTRTVRQRDEGIRRSAMLLEQRNRELDAFAGRVAHDLRGPLSTVALCASRFGEHVPEEAGTTAILKRGVARMEGLIQDLLELSRIDAQVRGAVAQTALVASAVEEDLRPVVERADGVLHVEIEPAQIRCGEGLARQVLWNLGENAVKYRREGIPLEVEIHGRDTGHDYEFCVSDNGLGMSPAEARQAFEPFFRGERARETAGTGLGLSIVKRIVEASGGTISIRTQSGRGTTFTVYLPLAST